MKTLLLLLGASLLTVPLFHRFRLGSVVAFLISGLLLGPTGFYLIQDTENLAHLSEFGVVMLLFLIGLELKPKELMQLKKSIFLGGGLQIIFSTLALSALLFGFSDAFGVQFDFLTTILVGFGLSLSSTAVGLQILQEENLLKTDAGRLSFSVLLFQDLAVIPVLVVLPFLKSMNQIPDLTVDNDFVGLKLMLGFLFLILLGVFSRWGMPRVLGMIARTRQRELLTAFSLFLIFSVSYLMEILGLSMALGAFAAGVLLANSEYRYEFEVDIAPFKGLLLGLFFITVGMKLNFYEFTWSILGFTIALLLCKIGLGLIIGRFFSLRKKDAWIFAISLSQVGEFAFVLFGLLVTRNFLVPQQNQTLALSVVLTLLSTSSLLKFVLRRLQDGKDQKPKEFDSIDVSNSVIVAGVGRMGQMIHRVLLARKIPVTLIDHDPNQIELLRKFQYRSFYGDATRLDLLESANIAKARLLVLALDDFEATLKVIEICKSHFPNVKILARCRNRVEAYELLNLGIEPFRETFGTSTEMAEAALVHLGHSQADADKIVKLFRKHDEKTLRISASHYKDETKLVNLAQTSRLELEKLLTEEDSSGLQKET